MNIVTSCILQCKLECAIVIVDNQTKPDTDNNDDNDSQYLSSGTRNHDGFGNVDFLTKDHHKTEGIEDALNSELVDRPKYQDSGLRRRELSSAPSTPSNRSLFLAMKQQVNDDTLSETYFTMHEPQGPLNKEAEEHSKRSLLQSCFI
jgi:hypothetical protein